MPVLWKSKLSKYDRKVFDHLGIDYPRPKKRWYYRWLRFRQVIENCLK